MQPFGGHGLSGTGPKAGGPLYLRRFLSPAAGGERAAAGSRRRSRSARSWNSPSAEAIGGAGARSVTPTPHGVRLDLPGPVGEQNTYRLLPRGDVLCIAATPDNALRQVAAALATGNRALVACDVACPALMYCCVTAATHHARRAGCNADGAKLGSVAAFSCLWPGLARPSTS